VRFIRRLLWVALRLIGILSGVCFVLYLYERPNPSRAETEQYAVYSAYLEPGLTGESHSLGSRSGLVVILSKTTVSDLFINNTRRVQYAFLLASLRHARKRLPGMSAWPAVNLLVVNLRNANLQPKFTLLAQYRLATETDAALRFMPEFERKFPGNYGYHTFSRVGFNRDLSEAFFYTEHVCGLCGGGRFVYMRKTDGKWEIVAESWTWIS